MGLFGYNAVLCALVFAGDKPEDSILAVIAGALSVFIYLIMNKYNLVALTFPFVVASCCILFVKKYILPSFMKRRIV